MITHEQHARIRRLYFAEHWKVGTIAAELSIHPDAVKRAIEVERFGTVVRAARPSMLDPFKSLILETLDRHPRLRATRVYEMVRKRGFKGSYKTVRRYVCKVRPAPTTEAFLALETLPGEQAQVDWARFGKIQIGAATRLLSLFVMVMSWSRAIYARFTLDQRMESFLRGHVAAFAHFGGVARTLLYDNLKSVVLDRVGEHVRFHPRILDLAGHCHFVPKPCAPYRGNEKGKVERAIQYIRHSFFAARRFRDVADLNAQLAIWLSDSADQRIRPTDAERRTVAVCHQLEREVLLPLPEHPFPTDLVTPVRSGKQPYVRFDTNRYSIPHVLVRKPLTLVVGEDLVRVLDGIDEVARHPRSYDRDQRIEDRRHLQALAGHKRKARELSGRDRLRALCPHAEALLEEMARRGEALRQHTFRLNQLLDRYGSTALDTAIAEALARGAPSASAIAHICDRRHRRTGSAPIIAPVVHADPRIRDLTVVPHDLTEYDALAAQHDTDDEQETDR
jgi:transposase